MNDRGGGSRRWSRNAPSLVAARSRFARRRVARNDRNLLLCN
jgi:hypothetical protein